MNHVDFELFLKISIFDPDSIPSLPDLTILEMVPVTKML